MLQMTKFFNNVADYVSSGRIEENSLMALNQMKNEITNRIHNSESGGKDNKGSGFGGYSTPYAKRRSERGLQTLNKDFEVTGDLRRSLKVVLVQNEGKIIIDNSKSKNLSNINKAKYLTLQHGKGDVIWKPSTLEINRFYALFERLTNDEINEIYESVRN